jgi:hypothetical protein
MVKGKHTLTLSNGTIVSGNIEFKKYIITNITTNSGGYLTAVKGYFTNKHNDYIYVNGDAFKTGRFKWIAKGSNSDGCFKYIDFPIKYE